MMTKFKINGEACPTLMISDSVFVVISSKFYSVLGSSWCPWFYTLAGDYFAVEWGVVLYDNDKL